MKGCGKYRLVLVIFEVDHGFENWSVSMVRLVLGL